MDFYQTEWLKWNETDISALEDENGTKILGEIVGATNLVAAKRVKEDITNQKSSDASVQSDSNNTTITTTVAAATSSFVNSYCVVYWGDDIIHRTKVISKNNNPIWSCDTGSLFMFDLPDEHMLQSKCLRIEVFDKISKKQHESIGEVILEGSNFLDKKWFDEKRRTFELIKEKNFEVERNENLLRRKGLVGSVSNFVTASLTWIDENFNSLHSLDNEIDDEDSLYGKSSSSSDETEIDDDFVFGRTGTLALRFRVASEDDRKFLKAVEIYEHGYKFAKRKGEQTLLAGVKRILDGKVLAPLITERSSSITNFCTFEEIENIIDYRIFGQILDKAGVKRYRVKPLPNPKRPRRETEFLTEVEMVHLTYQPSTKWVEAGSGTLGRIYVEILSCQGLSNKNMGKSFGNKADPFVCLIYEDCLVETDVIRNCQNPLFMPWSQRAFVFNSMSALSSLYLGVFDHDYGPFNHKGIGRVTIDLSELKQYTEYTLKYNLYNSPMTSNRNKKGSVTLRIRVEQFCGKQSLISMFRPPIIHVNVKRRKTLEVARFTCYGKYREEVYNMKILRGFIDEFFEYLEQFSSEINYSFDSLFFWRGQVTIFNVDLPLYSAIAYISAIYVIERPHLIPSYFFFCCAWGLLIILGNRSNYPAPLHRSKSFLYYCNIFLPLQLQEGENISAAEGHEQVEEMKKKRLERKEANKKFKERINNVRRDMQLFLASLGDLSLHTNEDGVKYNPLSRLLPLQLLLKELMFFIRCAKSVLSCDDSAISFVLIVCCFSISFALLILPIGKIFHWVCRSFVWFIMGPWMRIGETIANRKGSARHFEKVIEEMKEREQKRIVEARILKEEALKLRATRILRFGRFAIRVPFTNLTRYRDHPLPESYTKEIREKKVDPFASMRSFISVSHYIPGQKHNGVMIPELGNPSQSNLSEVKSSSNLMKYHNPTRSRSRGRRNLFQSPNKQDFFNNTSVGSRISIIAEPTKNLTDDQLKIPVQISVMDENEEGFEMILNEQIHVNRKDTKLLLLSDPKNNSMNKQSKETSYKYDDRNDIELEPRNRGQIESRCDDPVDLCIATETGHKSKVNFVLSDLTDNWT